ncbi:MAG: zinc-ribbon domain-containing protein [Terriglobales bacterium]
MAKFCTSCGSALDDGAVFCSKCGKGSPGTSAAGGGTAVVPAAAPAAGGLTDNVAGMLAYITIIPAIIFLVIEPYNRNRFIRFHSFQCIFLGIAWIVLSIALSFLPFFISWPLRLVLGLGGLALWIVLLIKAYKGQMWKVPIVGDMAEKQANA